MGKPTSPIAIRLRPLGLIPVIVFGLLTTLATGGGGGGGGGTMTPPPSPPADEGIGGAWVGTDSNGFEVVALSTDDGRLHWVSSTFDQGFGTASVNGSAITMSYTFVPAFGVLEDGSTYATCTATGTIQERVSVTFTTDCTTELGEMFSESLSLTYDPLYERDSSLALIAGNYDYAWLPDFGFGFVVNIDENGVIFAQEPLTFCVINGQVDVLDSQFNAYEISFTISSCNLDLAPEVAPYEGATFTGLGILDNSESPEALIAALIRVNAVTERSFSVVIELPRI